MKDHIFGFFVNDTRYDPLLWAFKSLMSVMEFRDDWQEQAERQILFWQNSTYLKSVDVLNKFVEILNKGQKNSFKQSSPSS